MNRLWREAANRVTAYREVAGMFFRHETEAEHVYWTDGSGSCATRPGGWAFVYKKSERVWVHKSGGAFSTTVNRMEMTAILQAMHHAVWNGKEKCLIRSDSQYCVKTLSEWCWKWEANGWKSRDLPVTNQDLIQEGMGLIRGNPGVFKIVWIKGHNRDPGNDRADKYAKAARMKLQAAMREVDQNGQR